MTTVPSIDPRTGKTVEIAAKETGTARVDEICAAALAAAGPLEEMGRDGRAALLDDLATALEEHRERIVAVADRETALGAARLNGELTRTCYQLRLFGEVLRDGGYLEAAVDHAGDTPMGPRPDLRRMLVPVGPVAVFGASNFPLAFSVPGGDTASAIAAGSPVVLKAHHSHPATSQLCCEILAAAAAKAGAPAGTFGIVHGLRAGADLAAHPAIRAVGFTGSVAGAKALLAVIEKRPEPIPFYGELSSLNPVVVTPAAAADRAGRIGAEFAASFTLGAGQFCTKPGLAFVPAGPDGDAVVAAAQAAIAEMAPMVMLNAGIAAAYQHSTATDGGGDARRGTPMLFTAEAGDLPPEATGERFGPVSVIARYTGEEDLLAAIATLPPSLTATVHRGPGETALPAELARRFRPHTGRLIFDGYPTGVAVAWAQHHGGPWPATNTQHTSVGATAIRRFLRPVTWQDAPTDLLPAELRDGYDSIPRRIDGVFRARL
ncbi:aldehyde dehydrogenase family protein [Actinoplanes hulinensis]|uniref:Aldehyde dehydrogenase family protein n=1 Tax=Actinoplanes hulinensis TaxID=1144547 RepID=A0ABS7BDU4_9ACTN|nr:aldehyde dehydrogenase family protein [Actinoplanes hulinensis]MBW6438654.1 aldehyde dehydrogenase family protein [Actinoplanes hulinensis]